MHSLGIIHGVIHGNLKIVRPFFTPWSFTPFQVNDLEDDSAHSPIAGLEG